MEIIILASLHLVKISMESANDHCPQESARLCQWMKCPLSYNTSQQIASPHVTSAMSEEDCVGHETDALLSEWGSRC